MQTTTTTTTPTTSGICQNLPSQDSTCKFFVSQSGLTYCTNKNVYIGGVLFSQACRLSCNLCSVQNSTILPTTTSAQCVDSQANCASWSSYCYLLVNQNPHPCRKTCNVCTSGSITTTTTTTKAPCVDSQPNCSFWSSYCSLLVNQNPHPCRKTCSICV